MALFIQSFIHPFVRHLPVCVRTYIGILKEKFTFIKTCDYNYLIMYLKCEVKNCKNSICLESGNHKIKLYFSNELRK